MAEKITGIVLNVRKYNDKNNIVTLYTRERGRVVFISPTGNGRLSNARRARLQPLGVVETEVNFKMTNEMQRLGSVNSAEIWTDLYFHPAKRAITMFVSEFLDKLLNDTMPDPGLFEFLVRSIRFLDNLKDGVVNFHLPFLVAMLTYSGIQPDVRGCREGYVFEFESGSFVPEFEAKGPRLNGAEAEAVNWVTRLNFSNMKKLRLNNSNRRQIFYCLLNYYSYHFPGLGSLKTPEILRDIF